MPFFLVRTHFLKGNKEEGKKQCTEKAELDLESQTVSQLKL